MPAEQSLAKPSLVNQTLAERITSALETSPYLNGRTLRFETDGSRVVMHGVVKSYFQKQMAQEAIRRVDGALEVENQLEVIWA
jgi:osmotically-inducible protein OsmY